MTPLPQKIRHTSGLSGERLDERRRRATCRRSSPSSRDGHDASVRPDAGVGELSRPPAADGAQPRQTAERGEAGVGDRDCASRRARSPRDRGTPRGGAGRRRSARLEPCSLSTRRCGTARRARQCRVVQHVVGVDAGQPALLDDPDERVPVARRHRLLRRDDAAAPRRCGRTAASSSGRVRRRPPCSLLRQGRRPNPRIRTGARRAAAHRAPSKRATRSAPPGRSNEPVADEVADLIDRDRAVEEIVQARRGGLVAVGGMPRPCRARSVPAARPRAVPARSTWCSELRPALEAVVARQRELRVGELRAGHSVARRSLACLRSCSRDGRSGRTSGDSDMAISFRERPRPHVRLKEDRNQCSDERLRWARPFPRTGCVLKRGLNLPLLDPSRNRGDRLFVAQHVSCVPVMTGKTARRFLKNLTAMLKTS